MNEGREFYTVLGVRMYVTPKKEEPPKVRRRRVYNSYSKEEDEIVKLHYPTKNRHFIESLLPNRTWKSVLHRAQQLGVRKIRSKKWQA